MAKATIEIHNEENRVLDLVKGLFGFKNKGEAINFVIRQYGEEMVKKELREEYIKKARKIMKEETIKVDNFEKKYLK